MKVRLQRLDFADTWTFAGLMAERTPSQASVTNCQFAAVLSTPSVNGTFFEYRTNGAGPQITGSFPANYPLAWLRLKRDLGTIFTGYASFDGLTWTKLGSVTQSNPPTMYVGLAVSSRTASRATVAEFRDFAEAGENDVVGEFSSANRTAGTIQPPDWFGNHRDNVSSRSRTDLRRMEFIELYNSNPTIEDISGFRISGDADYTFPAGTIISGGGYLVIAKSPADMSGSVWHIECDGTVC